MSKDGLPSGWRWQKLTDITKHKSGNSKLIKGKLHPEPADGRYPGFSASGQDVWLDHFDHEGPAIIASAVGARCGRCFRADGKWSAVANTHIIWTGPEIDRDFLWRRINDQSFWIRGGSAQPFIKVKPSFERPFALPPIEDQQRIVERVDALFAHSRKAKESLDRVPALLEKLKKSILAAAFRGDLTKDWREANPNVEPADQLLARIRTERRRRWVEADMDRVQIGAKHGHRLKPGRYAEYEPREAPALSLPAGWVWTSLGELSHFIVDYRGRTPAKAESGIPLVSSAAVKHDTVLVGPSGFVSTETYSKSLTRGRPKSGDVVITTEAPVGESALFPESETPFLLSRRVFACRIAGANPRFIMHAVYSDIARRHIEAHDRGTTVPRILKPDLLALPIPLPPRGEQDEMVDRIDVALQLCRQRSRQLKTIGNKIVHLERAILSRAFSGHLLAADTRNPPARAKPQSPEQVSLRFQEEPVP